MKINGTFRRIVWLSVLLLLPISRSFGQYTQGATNNFAPGPNLIEKSATVLTAATFKDAVAVAWTNLSGGVLNLPTTVGNPTTVFRGNYGNAKRFQITTSANMQNITFSATSFTTLSAPNGTTTTANNADYTLTLGLFDTNSGLPLASEVIKQVGFVMLSRGNTTAGYPLDIRATATFSDGSTQAVTSAIGSGSGADDTFFGFSATGSLYITSIRLQSFVTGTSTPIADRMAWDDFGFITGPSVTVPQPLIVNATPAAYAIVNATNGIHFEALTYESISTNNISVILNSTDVSSSLVFTGNSTNYSVAYSGLVPDQQYTMTINITNSTGFATLTRTFYTATTPFVLYDSGGFTNDTLYPVGPLQSVTNGQASWTPNPSEPAQIVDLGSPQNKVLQRDCTGASRADFLFFAPVSSGTVVIEFDAWVSTTTARTMDICLQPTSGGNNMASFLAWGELSGQIAYFDNVNWLQVAETPADWHHVKIINYLSGFAAGKYDVLINGSPVGVKLPWRNATVGSVFNQFRIQSQNTAALFEKGQIDNLIITAGPEDPNAVLPPIVSNVQPFGYAIRKPAEGVQFQVASQVAFNNSDVQLLLNSNNVSGQLVITGTATSKSILYTNLLPNQVYFMQILASNAAGSVSFTNRFYTYTNDFVLYDSGGFNDNTLYPVGPLGAVTNGEASWVPSAIPAEIVDTNDAPYVKTLRRTQTGADQIDNLRFSPIASGVITYSFDARVSDPAERATDFSLLNGSGTMSSFILLATNALNYIVPGGALVSGASLDGAWHHYQVVNYLTGSRSNTYDVSMDGAPVVYGAGWRAVISTPTTPLSRLRYGAIRGTAGVYGDMDNLIVTAGPERLIALPVTLLAPQRNGANFTFTFTSQSGVNHIVQYKSDVTGNSWTTLQTITGDGTSKTATHTNVPAGPLFYRVNSTVP